MMTLLPPSFAALPARYWRGQGGPFPRCAACPSTANTMTNETMKPEAPKTCTPRWRNSAAVTVVASAGVRLPTTVATAAVATGGVEPTSRLADTAGGSRGEILFEARDAAQAGSRNTLESGWGTGLGVRGGDEMAAKWGLGVSSLEGGAARRPGPWGQARRSAPSSTRVACDASPPPWGVPRLGRGTAEPGPA